MLRDMEQASLAISILAFVVSGVGFGWTVFEWHRSGARLKVVATSFVLMGHQGPFGSVPDRWLVGIEVTNNGRTATSVTAVGFQRPQGKGVLIAPEPAAGPNPLPARLEPGESFTWPMDPADVHRACKQDGIDFRDLRPYANSGHGIFVGKFAQVGLDVMKHREHESLPDAEA